MAARLNKGIGWGCYERLFAGNGAMVYATDPVAQCLSLPKTH